MMAKTWKITVSDSATYVIKSEDREAAANLALEWFSERHPCYKFEETDEEPEYTIKEEDND